MPHKAAIVGTGEAAICDQTDLSAQSHPNQQLHGLIHFRHTRSALGPHVADDNHFPTLDLQRTDAAQCILLVLKDLGRTCEVVGLLRDSDGLVTAPAGARFPLRIAMPP